MGGEIYAKNQVAKRVCSRWPHKEGLSALGPLFVGQCHALGFLVFFFTTTKATYKSGHFLFTKIDDL